MTGAAVAGSRAAPRAMSRTRRSIASCSAWDGNGGSGVLHTAGPECVCEQQSSTASTGSSSRPATAVRTADAVVVSRLSASTATQHTACPSPDDNHSRLAVRRSWTPMAGCAPRAA
ncbi:MAG TPA: hypothetical protein VHV74_14885 [Pseudonocardiaceae bacterium]|nr:hypothetical protein [Pseudonocardiaceae bacterium]